LATKGETLDAVDEVIAHWERMREYAGKQERTAIVNMDEMACDIGEDWLGDSCSLCELFVTEDAFCVGCPLDQIGENCNESHSIWGYVNDAATWGEWLARSEAMTDSLQEARRRVADGVNMKGVWIGAHSSLN